MEIKTKHLLLLGILILAAGFRLYNLRQDYFIGNDAFLHYSVIRQARAGGGLSNYNLSYDNPEILEPLGFYYVTLIPSYILGLDLAFLIMPLISGIVCIALSYYLIKDLFNHRVGLLTALILAICLAHMYRTSPNTYRGDGFYLTALIAILYCFNKTVRAKKENRLAVVTGILMGLSATLWNGYPIGVLVIVSGLVISLTLNYLKNKLKKEDLIKSIILLGVYYVIELVFLITGVVKRIFFTTNTGLHALITFSPVILGTVYYLTKGLKKKNVMAIILVAGVILLALNIGTITSMINEGLFENSLFYEIGVSELLAPELDKLFALVSWPLYLMWPGLIIFSLMLLKKQKTEQLTYMIWVIVSTYLMLNYMRYNFIASITTASLTALLLDYLYTKANKYRNYLGIGVLLAFFIPYAIESFTNINRIAPRVNSAWEQALIWANENLEPGMAITWWDHGSWVQYYTGFQTVVDSVNGQDQLRIKRIAEFLVTDKTEDFSDWGANYLILGGDVILYSGAVTGIAGVENFTVSLVGMGYPTQDQGEEIIVYPVVGAQFQVKPDETYFTTTIGSFPINKTLHANITGTSIRVSSKKGASSCLVINPYTNLFFNDNACNSNYVKLMYGQGLEGFNELYRNNYVVIYELV